MKIIDTHLHLCRRPGFDELASKAGHRNDRQHLLDEMQRLSIVACIAMGMIHYDDPDVSNLPLGLDEQFTDAGVIPNGIYYTTGINPEALDARNRPTLLSRFRQQLQHPRCLGMKIYAGYYPFFVTDDIYRPFINAAGEMGRPVIVHTGETSRAGALLRYAHPLTMDEAAVRYPRCHVCDGAFWQSVFAGRCAGAAKKPQCLCRPVGAAGRQS